MASAFIHQDFQGSVDKLGVTTGEIVWWVPSRAEIWTIGDAQIHSLPSAGRSFAHDDAHDGWFVTIRYEGVSDKGEGPESSDDEEVWEGELAFTQEPIEKHPDIATLKKTYGGIVGPDKKILWPETIPPKAGSSRSEPTKNPMFGVTDFISIGGDITHSYVVERSAFTDPLDGVGRIIASLPHGANIATPPEHEWMVLTPKFSRRGNVVQVTDRYRLSPRGGFPPDIYALLQL